MDNISLLNDLRDNAFEFLEKSIAEMNNSPKHSLICFYSAIELLLKARLMDEHWSLIVQQPGAIAKSAFIKGDFQSVHLKECVERIEKILCESISQDAYKCFNDLRIHRNKLVHFAHPDLNKSDIAVEQWLAWHFLHKLLSDQWGSFFSEDKPKIDKLHSQFLKYEKFLKERFKALKKDLASQEASGISFFECPVCNFRACKEIKKLEYGKINTCLVCEMRKLEFNPINITIECPCCFSEVHISSLKKNKENFKCTCGNYITTSDLISHYNKLYGLDDQDMFPAYCWSCKYREPSVFLIDDCLSCVACFLREEGDVSDCPYCGKWVMGQFDDYFKYIGCFLCGEENLDDLRRSFKNSRKKKNN